MDFFLKFLVRGMRTIDGIRGTADFLIEAATVAMIDRTEKMMNRKVLKKRESVPIEEDEEYCDHLAFNLLTLE